MIAPPKAKRQSLTEVASWSRTGIKFGIIFLFVTMFGRIALNAAVSFYKALNPPKPPGPTLGFGTLPEMQFPISKADVAMYTLQTKDGGLPAGPKLLPVFFMPIDTINLLSLDRAKKEASGLGFVFQEEQISPTMYRWKRIVPFTSVLQINIVNRNFNLHTDWASDPTFLSSINLPQESDVANLAHTLLASADLLATDIATSSGKVTFLKSQGSMYTSAPSYSEAEFLQYDLNRTPIDGRYPVLRPDPTRGNAHFIFSGNQKASGVIIDGEYSYTPIDYDKRETYPLITSAQAWQELNAGHGYVAQLDSGIKNVTVRDMYLGYFDADDPQQYLQPIYVFTGDNNFVGYVSAIDRTSTPTSVGNVTK